MPSKYDTNPLDPDFPEKVRAEAEGQPTQVLSDTVAAETRHFGHAAPTEEQTVRFGGSARQFSAPPPYYHDPYSGQYVPATYEQPRFANPRDRRVQPFNMPEGLLTAVPYIPWYIGAVAAAIVLYMTPRTETKVRFHAAQGLAAHIGIFIVSAVLGAIGQVSGAARAGNLAFTIATSIMLIVFALKAWKGKPVHIGALDGVTNWLEDKIHQKDR